MAYFKKHKTKKKKKKNIQRYANTYIIKEINNSI